MRALVTAVLCLVLFLPAGAQTFDITVKATDSGRARISLGDLGGKMIPAPVAVTLGLLSRWTNGTPTVTERAVAVQAGPIATTVGEAHVGLPVRGFALTQQGDATAQVRVERLTVATPQGPALGVGLFILDRPGGGRWRVTRIEVR